MAMDTLLASEFDGMNEDAPSPTAIVLSLAHPSLYRAVFALLRSVVA
jgi:hypothetical protein